MQGHVRNLFLSYKVISRTERRPSSIWMFNLYKEGVCRGILEEMRHTRWAWGVRGQQRKRNSVALNNVIYDTNVSFYERRLRLNGEKKFVHCCTSQSLIACIWPSASLVYALFELRIVKIVSLTCNEQLITDTYLFNYSARTQTVIFIMVFTLFSSSCPSVVEKYLNKTLVNSWIPVPFVNIFFCTHCTLLPPTLISNQSWEGPIRFQWAPKTCVNKSVSTRFHDSTRNAFSIPSSSWCIVCEMQDERSLTPMIFRIWACRQQSYFLCHTQTWLIIYFALSLDDTLEHFSHHRWSWRQDEWWWAQAISTTKIRVSYTYCFYYYFIRSKDFIVLWWLHLFVSVIECIKQI